MRGRLFDSVSQDYIRKMLKAYGLESFIPILDLLYDNQKVDVTVNGDVIEGYQIKNGMKQGDSLRCSLFILCMGPQIRSIEMNSNIDRIEDDGSLAPNLVTYSEDITCLTMNAKSIQLIFNEYDHLSKASGLVLNANKIEILDRRRRIYKIKYMGEIHEIGGSEVVKLNGIIFNADLREIREKNFQVKVEKITSMLAG